MGWNANNFYATRWNASNWWAFAVSGFPTQYAGLRIGGVLGMLELCLVDSADFATGMGGVPEIGSIGNKAVYLVETTDPNASPWRINTTTGVKAVRLKT